jgi:ATP-binding cassette subfamily F protein 3
MHLLSLVADRLWLVSDGRVTPFEQDLAAYRAFLLGGPAQKKPSEKYKAKVKKFGREHLIAARNEVRRSEERIEKITQMHSKLQEKLADPKLYEDHNAVDLAVWQKKFHEIETALVRAEKLWITATDTVEKMENV